VSERLRLAVLISGSGSNLKFLVDAVSQGQLPLEIVQVISNRADAGGLEHARQAGISHTVINRAMAAAGSCNEDQLIAQCLREAQPDLVLLSGYMRIVGAQLVDEFAGQMVNQHPSLLPLYKGLNTYARVLEAGDREHGASIHFVSAELDGGPLIAQVKIPVQAGDTPQTLAARLAPQEHRLLLAVMQAFCQRQLSLQGSTVTYLGAPLSRPLLLGDKTLET
jgi:phosphoribosylglycinamide formyltransferase-1